MENIHSILLIKKENKYLNYYDERWKMYLFPNIKGNNIKEIENKYHTKNIKFLFDKVHEKYSVSHGENRVYHHYFYELNIDNIEGEYFTLDELLNNPKVKENNGDVISFIKEYYKEQ